MGILYFIYNEFFYRPLLNGLVFITNILPYHDIGMAIIILTIIVKIILFPFTHKSIKTQKKIKEIEPELKKIKDKIKDKKNQAEEILKLYKNHGISPYSGFLMLLIQLPILIALYSVFSKGLLFNGGLYSFISLSNEINLNFLGVFNVMEKNVIFALLTGISQFIQIKLSVPPSLTNNGEKNNDKDSFNKILTLQMKYFMPALIFIIALKLPAAISLYWTTMNVFAIVHEGIIKRKTGYISNKLN